MPRSVSFLELACAACEVPSFQGRTAADFSILNPILLDKRQLLCMSMKSSESLDEGCAWSVWSLALAGTPDEIELKAYDPAFCALFDQRQLKPMSYCELVGIGRDKHTKQDGENLDEKFLALRQSAVTLRAAVGANLTPIHQAHGVIFVVKFSSDGTVLDAPVAALRRLRLPADMLLDGKPMAQVIIPQFSGSLRLGSMLATLAMLTEGETREIVCVTQPLRSRDEKSPLSSEIEKLTDLEGAEPMTPPLEILPKLRRKRGRPPFTGTSSLSWHLTEQEVTAVDRRDNSERFWVEAEKEELKRDMNQRYIPPNFRCKWCGVTNTPMRRPGPAGRGTLCNACGIRWKQENTAATGKAQRR